MRKPRTLKQRKFIRELIRTMSPTEAAMRSYNCKDRGVARCVGYELLTILHISMSELMDKMGLDIEQDIKDLKKLRSAKSKKYFAHEGVVCDEREDEDYQTQIKALEISLKLKGHLKEHKEDKREFVDDGDIEIIQHPNGNKSEIENRVKLFIK